MAIQVSKQHTADSYQSRGRSIESSTVCCELSAVNYFSAFSIPASASGVITA
jgi:hypothetical protein